MLLAKKVEDDLLIICFKGHLFSLNLSTMQNTIIWDKNIRVEGKDFWIDEFDVLFGGWCPKSERKERSKLLENPRNFRIGLEIDKMGKINKMWIDGNQIKLNNAQLYFLRSLNKRITNPLNSIRKLFRPYKACGKGKGKFWEVPITNLIWFMKDLGLEEEIRKLKEKF